MIIISDGENYSTLKTWVDDANKIIKHQIKLIKGVPYDKLAPYYSNSHIYIGMGTTVLEAADKAALCIPVAFYTYNCNADKLFSECPNVLALEQNEGSSIDILLKKIISMDDNSFLNEMKETKRALEENYSTRSFINKMWNRKVNVNRAFINLPLIIFVDLQRMIRKQIDKK